MQVLSIPDVQGNFYGGYPYSISLDIGFSDGGSTLTVLCVNEKGIYDKPQPSWTNRINIKVGDLNFQGFLVGWKKNNSVPQKTLELRYKDTSCLLDKVYIGLHKRHGLNTQASASYNNTLGIGYNGITNNDNLNLIILGREMHPCDVNNDGVITDQDGSNKDWCDPCPDCPPDKYEFRCDGLNDLKIFEVKYLFSDLLRVLGIPIPVKVAQRTSYYRDYYGKLRDVLSHWCDDFGYTFYWNFSASTLASGIKLVDRSVPISINFTPGDCEVTELYDGESIENCFAQGTISYYAREGQTKSYTCSGVIYSNLNCMRIRELYNPENYDNFVVGLKWRELAAGLSYYSSAMRDSMFWFNYYGILDASKAKEKIFNIALDSNPSYFQLNKAKQLNELGNMKIYQVITKQDDGSLFDRCSALVGDAIAPYTQRSKDLKRDDNNPSYYFFVAEYHDEVASTSLNYDTRLAEEFMGKFWIRRGDFNTCGGMSGNSRTKTVSVQGINGESANFIAQGTQGWYPEFSGYGHEEGSPIDSFIIDTKVAPEPDSDQLIKTTKAFILLERQAKWYPNKSDLPKYKDTLDYYQNLIFSRVDGSANGQPELLSSLNPEYSKNKNIYLFIVQEVSEVLTVNISNVDNFLEPSDLEKIYANNEDAAPCVANTDATSTGQTLIGTVGLKSSNCAWVNFNGFSFMMPAQATELQDGIGDTDPFNDNPASGGYKVQVNSSFEIPVCIPKIQTMLSNLPNPRGNFGQYDINLVEISDEDINIFGEKSCVPSPEKLKKIHLTKGIQTSISNESPERTMQYKIIGLPTNIPGVAQGLDGISIEVSDGGVFTSYSLSDKIREKPNYDLIISDTLRKSYSTVSSYPTPNPTNIPAGLSELV